MTRKTRGIARLVREYVEAAFEGRYSTADYVSSRLPPIDAGLIAPGDQRETYSCKGTIHIRSVGDDR